MAVERDRLRDWHHLCGLLSTNFFTGLPFIVEAVPTPGNISRPGPVEMVRAAMWAVLGVVISFIWR